MAEFGIEPVGGSSRRRRGSDRSPGRPAAAGAQARQLRPRDPARADRPALHRRWLRARSTTCNRSSSATSTWRALGGPKGGKGRRRTARHGLPGRARTPTCARPTCHLPAATCAHGRLVELNFAADPEDLRRLVGRRPPRVADRARAGDRPSRRARGTVLTEETINSEDALLAYVRTTVATQFHPCGTARMGPAGDPMAVVDQHCRVHASANLRVVDASVMPTIPRANINLTCIMIGERVVRPDAARDLTRQLIGGWPTWRRRSSSGSFAVAAAAG